MWRHEDDHGLSKVPRDVLEHKTVVRVYYHKERLSCERVQISRVQTEEIITKKQFRCFQTEIFPLFLILRQIMLTGFTG